MDNTKIIKEIQVTGDIPTARTEHTATLVDTNTVIVYGGVNGKDE